MAKRFFSYLIIANISSFIQYGLKAHHGNIIQCNIYYLLCGIFGRFFHMQNIRNKRLNLQMIARLKTKTEDVQMNI